MSKKHLLSIYRPSPAPGAAPGANHSVTSLRETTASMRSLIVIRTPFVILYKILDKRLLTSRKTLKINEIFKNEILNSYYNSLHHFIQTPYNVLKIGKTLKINEIPHSCYSSLHTFTSNPS